MHAETPPLTSARSASGTLAYFPVAMFGSVMGLTGLGAAWRMAVPLYSAPTWIGDVLAVLAMLAFVAVVAAYATKLVTSPDAARQEFRHPVAGNTFATFFVSLLLLPIVIAPSSLGLARTLWTVGAVGSVPFAWLTVRRWLAAQQDFSHATPAWLLSLVGLLDLPLAVPHLHIPALRMVMLPGLAVGLFYAALLFSIVFGRMVFGPPLPPAMAPQSLMLLTPFSVGMSTYVATTGSVDLFAKSLLALALFLLAVLAGRLRQLRHCCPFRVAWWAVSFPLAATTLAALQFAAASPSVQAHVLAFALLATTTAVIAWLLVRTLSGVLRGELRALSA